MKQQSTASMLMKKFGGVKRNPPKQHQNQADQRSVVVYAYVVQKITEFFLKNKFRTHSLNYELPVCSWETPFYKAELYRKLRVHCRSKHEYLNNVVFIFDVNKDVTPEDYQALLDKLEELYCSDYQRFVDVTPKANFLPETHRVIKETLPKVLDHFDESVVFTSEWKLEANGPKMALALRLCNVIDNSLIQMFSFDITPIMNMTTERKLAYLEDIKETIAQEIFEALQSTDEFVFIYEVIEDGFGDKVKLEK